MTDARWSDIDDDLRRSLKHFRAAIQIYKAGDLEGETLESYKSRMALMQAMASGYTGLENAFLRVFEMLGETKPAGQSMHADIVRRLQREIPGLRPALLDLGLGHAVDTARRFRHISRHVYDTFTTDDAGTALDAAAVIVARMPDAFAALKRVVDPD